MGSEDNRGSVLLKHADAELRTRLAKISALLDLERTMWERSTRAWPGIEVGRDAFFAGVAARLAGDPDPAKVLPRMTAPDLYLAIGCEHADVAAIRGFERTVLPSTDPALHRLAGTADEIAEARQALRARLLVGPAPKIKDYAGRGPLIAWVRVAAVRILHNLRRGRRVCSADDELLERLIPHEEPELSAIKESYRVQFREAFAVAVESLEPQQRTLLRQHWVDGLASSAIAGVYGVHRATVSRWIVDAQAALVATTRCELGKRLRLDEAEVRSVIRLIESRFDASIHRMIAKE